MPEWIKPEHVTEKMSLDDFISYVIPSKDVLEYVEQIGHKFNEWEIATLIYNSTLTCNQRFCLQHKLYRTAGDNNLKMQLRHRRFLEAAIESAFVNAEQGCFYAVMAEYGFDDEKLCIGHFADFEQAKACGVKGGRAFDIEKYQIVGAKEEPVKNYMMCSPEALELGAERYREIPYCGDPIGRGIFDGEGNLLDVTSEEIQIDWRCDFESWDDSRYEDRFVYIPHPFKTGDLVRGVNRRDFYGMVITTDDDYRRIAKWKSEGKHVEYLDGALTILYLNDCGELDHTHIMPQYLERANITDILEERNVGPK